MRTSDRRFFFHYRKADGKMSVHFKKTCIPCDEVSCSVPCETKRNKQQPRLVMQGYADRVEIWQEAGGKLVAHILSSSQLVYPSRMRDPRPMVSMLPKKLLEL